MTRNRTDGIDGAAHKRRGALPSALLGELQHVLNALISLHDGADPRPDFASEMKSLRID